MRQPNPRIELASGEYDRRKQHNPSTGIATLAKELRVSEKALRNYRANYISRRRRP